MGGEAVLFIGMLGIFYRRVIKNVDKVLVQTSGLVKKNAFDIKGTHTVMVSLVLQKT